MSMPNNPFGERDPYQWDQPQPMIPSGLWKFMIVVVVMLVLGGILTGLVMTFVGNKAAKRAETVVKQRPQLIHRAARERFNRRKFVPPKQKANWHDHQPIVKILDQVAVTTRKQNWAKFRTYLNTARHAKRVAEKGDLQSSHLGQMVTMLRNSRAFPLSIERQTIAHIDFSTAPIRTAMVYTYTQEKRSDHWRMRWELVHEAGNWKILDWDLLDWDHSDSTQNAELHVTTGEVQREHFVTWHRELGKFYKLSQGKTKNLHEALTVAKTLSQQIVRPIVRGEVSLRTGNCYRDLGYFGTAISHYKQALKQGLPGANRDLANFYFTKNMYKPAIAAASAYLQQLGSGPWVHSLIGRSHLALGNLKKARRHLELALDCDANYQIAIENLARTVGSKENDLLERRIMATKDPVESRLTVVTRLSQWGNVKAATQLLSPLLRMSDEKKLDKKVAKRVFDRHIQDLLTNKKLKQAVALRRQRWKAAKAETDKTSRLRELHNTIFYNSKVEDLFRLSPDPRAAILYVIDADQSGGAYVTNGPAEKKFLVEYSRKNPSDFLGPYATARLVLSSIPERAKRVEHLRRAISLLKKSDETWQEQINNLLVKSLLDLNKLDDAYKLVQPKDSDGLYKLANHCVDRRDWLNLRAVVTRYSHDNPGKSTHDIELLKALDEEAHDKHQAVVDRLAKVDKSKIPKSQLYSFNRIQRESHLRLGKAKELLAKSKDKWQTYRQLMPAMRRMSNTKQVEAVSLAFIDQTSNNNHKAEAFYNLCDFKWQTKQYNKLIEALNEWPRAELVSLRAYQRSTLAERLVRSYIRQNNAKEAVRVAKWIASSTGETKPLVIAALAQENKNGITIGDVTLATDAMQACWNPVRVISSLSDDQDVGEMVRSRNFPESTQFVPHVFGWARNTEWLVLLKNAPQLLTSTDLRNRLKGYKDLDEVESFNSDWTKREKMNVFLLKSKKQRFTITFGRKPLKSRRRATAQRQRSASLVADHQGWVSIRLHQTESRIQNLDAMGALASHLRVKDPLMMVFRYKAGAMTKALKEAIAKKAPIKQIRTYLTESTWLTSPIPPRKYLGQGELFAIEDAFRNLKPGQRLQVAFSLSMPPVSENMWLTVEQIQYPNYYYRREFIGEVEKHSKLLPYVAKRQRIRLRAYQIEKYRIVSSNEEKFR